MKVYRDWRISGDSQWLKRIYPMVRVSMDYAISTWDPKHKGVVEEPHHNTYDIEFWGPDGMCTSFYLGALTATIEIGNYLKQEVGKYQELYVKGKKYLETRLYNGEYFFQDIEYKNLNAPDPSTAKSFGGDYYPEAKEILKKEGPKYQYGTGCLSDEVWTGIEYQVASHLMLTGNVQAGLEIVRTFRDRYDGRIRNPFNEYECGHWYARAMSSYGLLQALTGIRYDAVEKTLFIDSKIGDFTSFISTASGFGTVSLRSDKPSVKTFYGSIPLSKISVNGKEVNV